MGGNHRADPNGSTDNRPTAFWRWICPEWLTNVHGARNCQSAYRTDPVAKQISVLIRPREHRSGAVRFSMPIVGYTSMDIRRSG